jgi:regulator of sigma E protease
MELAGLIPAFGNLFLTAIAFVVALSVIVAIHEYGHYIVGRWSGIHAEVFSLGFGPRLWSRIDKRGTRWQIAALPFGGYVKFLGDANAASAGADTETMAALSPEERRHTMHGAPLWARAATVAAGPIFNFILSIAVFSVFFIVSGAASDKLVIGSLNPLPGGSGALMAGDEILALDGKPTPDWDALNSVADGLPADGVLTYHVRRDGKELDLPGPYPIPPRASAVLPGTAAMDSGLRAGDVITRIDGKPLVRFNDMLALVTNGNGAPMVLDVWRAGQDLTMTLSPRLTDYPDGKGGFVTSYKIGLTADFFFTPTVRKVGLLEAVPIATGQTWTIAKTSVSALWNVIKGTISQCNMRGPIGIAKATGEVASQGLPDFIWFIAVLSTAIGLMNLFPVPMLDGGHLVFYCYEWATGRPLPPKVLNIVMTFGLMLVVAMMSFGLFNDLTCP